MPTSSRRTRVSVIEQLLQEPQDFAFSQAVRLLERAAVFAKQAKENEEERKGRLPMDHPIARFSPPTREAIRFLNRQNLGFPETEISGIQKLKLDDDTEQWKVFVNFVGLTGSMGVMPFHYSEMLLQRLKLKDPSISEFFNLFNHRTTSLFFQASNKYRLPIEYERHKLNASKKSKECSHTQSLLSLLGLGTGSLRDRQALNDESIIFYAGLFTQQVRTPSNLSQMIEDYFDVPVKIEGFIGQWQELIDDVRTKLPWKGNPNGQNVCLGRSSMLGRKGWFAQGKSRVKLGPLNKEQFNRFAPGTGALKSLNELVTSYLGMEQDYDFVLEVTRDDVPNKIALKKSEPPLLAWNAWLAGKPNTNTDKDELLEIKVSSKSLK